MVKKKLLKWQEKMKVQVQEEIWTLIVHTFVLSEQHLQIEVIKDFINKI